MNCPTCEAPGAYQGLNKIECANTGCMHYDLSLGPTVVVHRPDETPPSGRCFSYRIEEVRSAQDGWDVSFGNGLVLFVPYKECRKDPLIDEKLVYYAPHNTGVITAITIGGRIYKNEQG